MVNIIGVRAIILLLSYNSSEIVCAASALPVSRTKGNYQDIFVR